MIASKKLYALGEALADIGLGACLKFSVSAITVGAAIAILRIDPGVDNAHSAQIFWLLLQYGFMSLVAIFVLALLCKGLTYGLGKLLLWAIADDVEE